ncbi:uncharacterized protein LOC132299730 [Cornus florida]|uniref:uncharacterized protein LOC132299730 n=1 Tax=Cornus florida TaxID=4283 RepID=UPI00289B525D|nr:uncharacterized protein LOC132299730 [Cornus florida]
MQKTLQFKPQLLISEASVFFDSNSKIEISTDNCFSVTRSPLVFRPSNLLFPNQFSSHLLSLSNQSHTQNQIICARSSKRRFGSQRSRKFILELVGFVASNLNILPEPLGLVIREFGGGNGGGLGFPKGFGGGGFDGWRGKRKKNLGFLGFLMVFGLGLWLLLGKEMDKDVFWGGSGLALFGVLITAWKRGAKDWILGFCFGAVLMGVGLKREELQKWAKGCRAMEIVRRRKRRRAI